MEDSISFLDYDDYSITSCHDDAMSAFLSCASSQPPTETYESGSNLMFENEIDAYLKVTI